MSCSTSKALAASTSYSGDDGMASSSTSNQNMALPPPPPQRRTFYRRPLPASCVALSSEEGQARFASSMATKGLKSFFLLIEQFTTQSEPAFCGISTLVICLNALAVDPRRTWKGPWRWFSESMLNCCLDMDKIKETGITINDFRCLAICQGLAVDTVLAENSQVDAFRQVVRKACVASSNEESQQGDCHDSNDDHSNKEELLVVSYSRKVLGQTGSGHFSPIAAYDAVSDSVLILDTARFKYGAHWVSLPLLFDAMIPVDPDTGKSRGYILLSDHDNAHSAILEEGSSATTTTNYSLLPSVLFRSQRKKNPIRREYKAFLSEIKRGDSSMDITLDHVISFWTKDGTEPSYIWNMMEPQFRPLDDDLEAIALIKSVRSLVNNIALRTPHQPPPRSCCECRVNFSRTLNLSPIEAIFVVYLASLDEAKRKETVLLFNVVEDAAASSLMADKSPAQTQLLAEAELIRYAIDMSDETC